MTDLTANSETVKTLTVLRDPNNIQVKTITPESVVAATVGEWFKPRSAEFNNLTELYQIISGLDHHELVIHAQRTTHVSSSDPTLVRCTVHKHRRTGDLPFFQDRPSPTLTIDLDDTLVPAGCSWERPTELAGRVWADLQAKNPVLQGVGCVWKTSGSAAAPGREKWAKLHFTVILGHGLLWHDRQTLLEKIIGADTAMSRIVQKHYLAGRICVGMVDPLANVETCGVVEGADLWWVSTPPPVANPYEIDVQISTQTTAFGNEKLRIVSSMISNAPLGTRHDTVLRLSFLIGGYVGGGEIAEADAYQYLRAAVQGYGNPKHHHVTIADAVPAGIDKPRSNVADWAQEVLSTDFDPKQLAEYAMTLEDDQRDLLLDLMDQHVTSKKKKLYEKHFKVAENIASVDTGTEHYSQMIQFGGAMAKYVFVQDDEMISKTPLAVDVMNPNGGWPRRNFNDLTSALGTVPQLNADGKLIHTSVADYWWDAETTPRYEVIGFDPNQPKSMTDGAGRSAINSYRPAHPLPAQRGQDVSPFLFLLRANIPDEGDQALVTGALAHAVQKPGERLQYALVMQGVQGCGKGVLIKWTLQHCCGSWNIGLATPKMLLDQFNGYPHRKTVVVCDEIGERKWADMTDILENLKEPITEARIPIRKMRRDAFDVDNFATFFFMTNHIRSMLANDHNERRYMHFISAMQQTADVAACLPISSWDAYPAIADVLRRSNRSTWFTGYALWWSQFGGADAVRGYLEHEAVALTAGGRAPITTSTEEAHRSAVSPIERIIKECIEFGDLGFGGGYVSSNAIRHALAVNEQNTITPIVMRQIMSGLGYKDQWRCSATPNEAAWFPSFKQNEQQHPRFTVYSNTGFKHDTSVAARDAYVRSQDTANAPYGGQTMGSDSAPPMVN